MKTPNYPDAPANGVEICIGSTTSGRVYVAFYCAEMPGGMVKVIEIDEAQKMAVILDDAIRTAMLHLDMKESLSLKSLTP